MTKGGKKRSRLSRTEAVQLLKNTRENNLRELLNSIMRPASLQLRSAQLRKTSRMSSVPNTLTPSHKKSAANDAFNNSGISGFSCELSATAPFSPGRPETDSLLIKGFKQPV